ncbi:hypothetical protein GDO86_012469 [Hymenochirus boettgeri]|uniref:Uncharacterized protein n=1 Tax=Hymenochirus boettgeri TaxID=247094 RepID=A0A8T2IMD3_9PIPI|nr:hypothetical protein GDO86_012469 [Hymenochirus boettgeri]
MARKVAFLPIEIIQGTSRISKVTFFCLISQFQPVAVIAMLLLFLDPNTVTYITCPAVSGGYGLKVDFQCPSGKFTHFDINVNNKMALTTTNCTQVTVSDLKPATSYLIEIRTVASSKSVLSSPVQCSTDATGVIVGSVLGVLLFLLLLGLIAFFVMKKRRKQHQQDIVHSIHKEKFSDHFQEKHADSDFGFAEDYQQLSNVGTKQSARAAELPDNRVKNRFTNVLPYDHSRVKLSCSNGNLTTDYINANYMPGYNSSKEFIATQGPLPNTSADFWRMVWEHQVNTIVMLTNCMENSRVKCEHYWPLDYTPCTYGDITVTVTKETILPEWTIRDFSLKHVGYQDAGVGRTGTLIALDYLIQQMEKEQRVGVYSFVEKMRMNRGLMVQTEGQYIFLNKCMLDLIEQSKEEENVYENQINDLIYENASVVREYQKDRL